MGAADAEPGPLARSLVAAVAAVVAVAVLAHLAVLLVFNAPRNAISARHGDTINAYVHPELSQNWKVFAPNPMRRNLDLLGRAEVRGPDGAVTTTRWRDLTAEDLDALRGSVFPSVSVEQFRQAWTDFIAHRTSEGAPLGVRGDVSERLITRLAVRRLAPEVPGGGRVVRIQLREVSRPLAPPAWQPQRNTAPTHRDFPWIEAGRP
ncbi:DUF5819 family protein [Streptomyces monticola]|uniref:DUF5819 family protein n=1 Tax=Streptomyces monticola TaxID=2666263 RepID=A0ABW2JCB6_9ACTN